MRLTTLQFSSIIDLVDFQMATAIEGYYINYGAVTLTGNFIAADIELAKVGYKAIELAFSSN